MILRLHYSISIYLFWVIFLYLYDTQKPHNVFKFVGFFLILSRRCRLMGCDFCVSIQFFLLNRRRHTHTHTKTYIRGCISKLWWSYFCLLSFKGKQNKKNWSKWNETVLVMLCFTYITYIFKIYIQLTENNEFISKQKWQRRKKKAKQNYTVTHIYNHAQVQVHLKSQNFRDE